MRETGVEFGESAPELPERAAIMEQAREHRRELFANVLIEGGSALSSSRASHKALNFIPLAGDVIMSYRAVRGTEGGRELPKSSRIFYIGAALSTLVSLLYLKEGQLSEAGAAHLASELFTKADALLALLQDAAAKLTGNNPELAATIAAVGTWLGKHKDRMRDLKELFDDSVLTLDLNDYPRD